MALWWMFFMRGFDGWFWDSQIDRFVNGVFVYGTPYSSRDGNEGVGVPPIVLHGIDQGVVFIVCMCEGLIRASVMVVCEFDELGCECVGG